MQTFKGLNDSEVLKSRAEHGDNILTPPVRDPWWKLFFAKFNDPIIKLLLFATLLSMIVGYFHGSMTESIGIIIAVLLATVLSFINEYKAGKEFDILNQINDSEPVKVYRNGQVTEIPKTEIVVGDYVIIEQGDEIPADGTVASSMSLSVNESSLNGESVPANKFAEKVSEFKGTYSPNMCYRGTTVSEGSGVIEVSAVGDSTEIGKTARQASEITGAQTPLNRQLDKLSSVIGKVGFIIAGVTFAALVVRGFMVGELSWSFSLETATVILGFFMIAVTLIVVAVPEGLAMSVTLSLAYSMRKMTANNTLVRKMHACETMGATTVICTDKTGTLTQNKMMVQYSSMEKNDALAESIALNSTAHLDIHGPSVVPVGNPTEAALLILLHENGYDYKEWRSRVRLTDRLVFSTERKFMASLVESEVRKGEHVLYLKGAPEVVMSKTVSDADTAEKVLSEIRSYQEKGMRALGFASVTVDKNIVGAGAEKLVEEYSGRFTFDGYVAIADPIRNTVPGAMKACLDAGIQVKIVTGDVSTTAREIARQSGLWLDSDGDEAIITGSDFAALSDDEAREVAGRIKVMSRARPADKMRLVRLLQERGEVVAVTGDGTNDAPALNYADVGLSMGSGTSVAKEASDIVLLDDSFASIVSAVQWGRSLYLNIQRFIQFQLTINVVALLTALIGPFIGVEFPLTVTQMLWVNLIMDTFAALALATESSDPVVMKNKPRKITDFIVTKAMAKNIFGQGLLFVAVLLGVLVYFMKNSPDGLLDDVYELSMFFTLFVMIQFWNLFNVRAMGTGRSALSHLGRNMSFVYIALLILVLQIVIVTFGGEFFRTVPLSLRDWLIVAGGSSLVLIIGETGRFITRKRKMS